MKIAILTLPLHTNYGGILQAYALQKTLSKMGHKVVVLDKARKPIFEKYPFHIHLKRFIKKYILFQDIPPLPDISRYKLVQKQNKYTWKFADKYIHRKEYRDFVEIKESDFDAIIVGSDQVWRPRYFPKHISNAFLSFAKEWNIRRIAYAPSFGTDNWEYTEEETAICKELIKLFSFVSVREISGIELLKNKLNYPSAKLGIDPCILLTKEEYITLFKKKHCTSSKGNLLTYIIDTTPEKQLFIDRLAIEKRLKPFKVNSNIESATATLKERKCTQPAVEKWIRGFYDAEYVITDSFHACIFSIIFGKPFLVIGNKERGLARFTSLLELFNLKDRLIINLNEFSTAKIHSNVKIAQLLLDNYRKLGYDFLFKALNNNDFHQE